MAKLLKATGMNKCIGCLSCMLACAAVNQKDHSLNKSAIKIRTYGGLQGKFYSTVCLGCKEQIACFEACPSGALQPRSGGGVIFNSAKCIGCRRCEKACIASAVFFDEETKFPIICKHCSVCTQFCPHDCLEMEG
ncbi:MAG: 4Fe-4S dicluster domain-containing protein [Clostridia bacterium]